MAAKRVDPLKAKEAKQKKIAIGGLVLLLALLGVQGPKTLKMLQGPQPIEDPVAAAAVPLAPPGTPLPAGAPPAGGTAAGATSATPAPDVTSLADSDPAPAAEAGQLATFERFASKDPFAQQADAVVRPRPAAPSDGETSAAAGDDPDSESDGGDAGFTPAGAGGGMAETNGGASTTDAPQPAAATSIAVNGVPEDVQPEQAFPAGEPTFVLVSLAKDGKSAEIGIAGGAYAGGAETIELTVGKKLTLRNTADGSTYVLELLAVAGFPAPKLQK